MKPIVKYNGEVLRKNFDKKKFNCMEVIDLNNKVYFGKDNDSKVLYTKNGNVRLVDNEIVDKYIDNWMDHKELPTKETKLYCKMAIGGYLAIDNSSGECYVEEFETEEQVYKWFSGKDLEEEILK